MTLGGKGRKEAESRKALKQKVGISLYATLR